MIYKNKSVLMVALSLVLALALAGCSVALGAANITDQTPEDEVSQSPVTTETSSAPIVSSEGGAKAQGLSDDPVLEAYQSVLQNETEFFSADSQKDLYLNDFLTNNGVYEVALEATRFTVLDMDGDGVPEVVLELSVGGVPEFYEVLYDMDGKVYGYLVVYRGLEALKADGTFGFSSGAADNGWGRMSFGPDGYTTDMLGYSESSQDGDNVTIAYLINGESVTAESFDAFANEQSVKDNAVWYEFSQENIEAEL